MKRILESNNRDLLREVEALNTIVANNAYPSQLQPYAAWIDSFLQQQKDILNGNFRYLDLGITEIFTEVLERTQSVTRNLRIISNKFITPISRYNSTDYISICFIKWLHDQHPQSVNKAFAVSDGQFSIFPSVDIPVIYYLPSSSQRSLLHLPLFFHEYGHFLFQYHKDEMVDLIIELQNWLEEQLVHPYQQNDSRSLGERRKAKKIIETWFDWIEEIYCDAVGLTIGGSSFLHTFSLYLRMSGREAFYLSERDLENSSHPVSSIRIKFLVRRARKLGLHFAAKIIEDEWKKLSDIMSLNQMFHGYYTSSYDTKVEETIDNMLEESNPVRFDSMRSISGESVDYVNLVNEAWERYFTDENSFEKWQDECLNEFLRKGSNGISPKYLSVQ